MTEHFETTLQRRFSVKKSEDLTWLTVTDTGLGASISSYLAPGDLENLVALLTGDKVKVAVKVGDLLRVNTDDLSMHVRPGALAIVTRAESEFQDIFKENMADVHWIDDRSVGMFVQDDGAYKLSQFDVIEKHDLSDEDYQSIGRRASWDLLDKD